MLRSLVGSEMCIRDSGNRAEKSQKTQWHKLGVRGLNTLFGDGHAAIFVFPPDLHNWAGRKPDPANGFW